ncbi:MAG: hypothetical protein WA949_13300 [Phormidesmis sp.]
MDSATAGLIGAAIGASTGLASTLLTNWLGLKKEKEQWKRNIESEHERWLRENLQDVYGNCLYSLSRLLAASEITIEAGKLGAVLSKEHQREFFLDYSEAQKWLGLLLIYHPSKGSGNYSASSHQIATFSNARVPQIDSVQHLRGAVINLASKDIRLHSGASGSKAIISDK